MAAEMITGLTVWVTGATSGIGRALVCQLVRQGNFVVASGRNHEKLQQMQRDYGDQLATIVCDVSNDDSMARAQSELYALTDYLDLVLACAGVCDYEDDLSFNIDIYERALQTNCLGVIRTLKTSEKLMSSADRKSYFVAVGSLSSALPFPRAEAYGTSKIALEYFIKSCRIDSKGKKWEIKLVRPGFVDTPMTSQNDFTMPFKVSAEEAAEKILSCVHSDKVIIDFPRRLSWMLRAFNMLGDLWIKIAANKLSRSM